MDLGLSGKTAYITGGARGIGAAIADALVAEGVWVAVSDKDSSVLEHQKERWTVNALAPILISADLSTSTGCRVAAETALTGLGGDLDILINNVGACVNRPFEEITDENWLEAFNINLMSCVRTSRIILPLMAAQGSGAVVNIASDLAKQPEDVPADYGAFKTALLSLTKSLAIAYAPKVRINAILPGPIWTELWTRPGGVIENMARLYGLPGDQALAKYLSERRLLLGIGEPADVAAMTVFLVSARAKHLTAGAYQVDGGSIRGM